MPKASPDSFWTLGKSYMYTIIRMQDRGTGLRTFPVRVIDTDNNPIFMNRMIEAWCVRPWQQIVLTRSRAYKLNDQAWVEQKNGILVRREVGYQRLVSLEDRPGAGGAAQRPRADHYIPHASPMKVVPLKP
jgi:hypothetical protein